MTVAESFCGLPTPISVVRAYGYAFLAVAVTVTVFAPPFSATLDGFTDSLRGVTSSSASIRVVPITFPFSTEPLMSILSSPSSPVSCFGVSVNVWVALLAFAGMVMSKLRSMFS